MATAPAQGGLRPVAPIAILADRLAWIEERLERIDDLDPRVLEEVRRAARLAGGLDAYTERCSTPASPALRELARRSDEAEWGSTGLEPEMLSGHVEGQLLRLLVRLTRARRVLEIGMFTGYSALAMAEALPDDGLVVACELDEQVAAFAQECFATSPVGHRISVRSGPALDTLARLEAQGAAFDLVFVDADKAGYVDYYSALLDGALLAPGALICVDNTLMQGEPWLPGPPGSNGAAIAAFNDLVAADPRVEQVLLPVRDGLTLIRRVEG